MEPGFHQFGASGFAMMAGFGDATLWYFFLVTGRRRCAGWVCSGMGLFIGAVIDWGDGWRGCH